MSVPIYMLDFEGSASSGILEYGVVELREGQIAQSWTRLCRPQGRIAQRDRLTHGLSDAALSHCQPIEADWEFFSGLRETGVLAAHHAVVEAGLLKSVWPCPRLSPDFSKGVNNTNAKVAQWGPWIDSLALYRRIYPKLASYGLASLIEQWALQEELDALARCHCPPSRQGYHRALYDALASALLLKALIELPQFSATTLADWIGWSQSTPSHDEDSQMAFDFD